MVQNLLFCVIVVCGQLASVDSDDWDKVGFVDVLTLQMGQLINLYVLTVSMFGSFLLVYSTEGGMDSIDMVLNAVALFFMIELDDFMVSSKDYEVVEDYVHRFIESYDREKSKENKVQMPDLPSPRGIMTEDSRAPENMDHKTFETRICGKNGLRRFNKVLKFVAVMIFLSCILCACIAPFIVMACW